MKKNKIVNFIMLATTLIFMFASCTKTLDLPDAKDGSDPIGIDDTPTNPNAKTYKLNLNDFLKIAYFDYYDGIYTKWFDITNAFPQGLPKAGDRIEVSYEGIAPADIRYLYCFFYDYNGYSLTKLSNYVLIKNMKKGEAFKNTITIPLDYTPSNGINFQMYYNQNDYDGTLLFGESTGFGSTAPENCDSIWDFKNTDNNNIAIITALYIDGKIVETSDFRIIKPNASERFYYNFSELEAKYGDKLYGNNSYLLRNIHVFPFNWTDSNLNSLNFSCSDWIGWTFAPASMKNKKRTTLESFEYVYNSTYNCYYHQPYNNENNSCVSLTEQDKLNPDLPYSDTVVKFPYNPYGPNYQTNISLFDDTPLAKGDKIKVTISGIAYDSIPKLYANITDVSEAANYWFNLSKDTQIIAENIGKERVFSVEYTFEILNNPISSNPEDIKLVLSYYDLHTETSIEHCTISFEKL